jgi:hypothetical protein
VSFYLFIYLLCSILLNSVEFTSENDLLSVFSFAFY